MSVTHTRQRLTSKICFDQYRMDGARDRSRFFVQNHALGLTVQPAKANLPTTQQPRCTEGDYGPAYPDVEPSPTIHGVGSQPMTSLEVPCITHASPMRLPCVSHASRQVACILGGHAYRYLTQPTVHNIRLPRPVQVTETSSSKRFLQSYLVLYPRRTI